MPQTLWKYCIIFPSKLNHRYENKVKLLKNWIHISIM
jgi:hypothetical protein